MIDILLVHSPAPRVVHEQPMRVTEGTTVALALQDSGWLERVQAPSADWTVGIWGRKAALDAVLRQGDRLELYRDLKVDPKVARRERFHRQGAGAAGLFARRRPGAKPGY